MKTFLFSRSVRRFIGLSCALLSLFYSQLVHAEIQFDVFLGYEGLVREGAWFPIAVEIHNDGPSFDAVFEISPAYLGNSQARRVRLELPSNTRKRFFIPVFGATGRMSSWNARLLDSKGKVRAERLSLRPKDVAWEAHLLGAVPRSFTTAPTLPVVKTPQAESQPQVGRIATDLFPDNPITLEALSALYLNSEKAIDFKAPQQAALVAWVHSGGHLVLAIEQPSDVNSLPWLKQLIPGEIQGLSNVPMKGELDAWLKDGLGSKLSSESTPRPEDPTTARNRARKRNVENPRNPSLAAVVENPRTTVTADSVFANATLSVAHFIPTDAKAVLQREGTPLIVSANRGAGKVTLILFSPEREPFKSWKNKAWFWAKIMEIPESTWFPQNARYGGRSLDGVFGAMIDSRQASKLPVPWLLGILGIYLIVIGPFDHYILKKINRQMLTWITFPVYVLTFSLLIYFIGYKLRAGETEWNELHVVDILPRGNGAEWRGHTFASLYSPANAEYQIGSDQPHSTVRGEYGGVWMGNQDTTKARVEQLGKGFDARIFVPVWTSQLLVTEWMQPGAMPITVTLSVGKDDVVELALHNNLSRKLGPLRIVLQDRIHTVESLDANGSTHLVLSAGSGGSLQSFVQQQSAEFLGKIENRQRALGDAQGGRINNLIDASMAACFTTAVGSSNPDVRSFVYAPGFDLYRLTQRGDAVLLVWDANQGATTPLNKFDARRTQKNTLLRLVVPVPARGG